ncbi:hypothetical protein D9619_009632 [Psilocybe cf. subviscida]|uniref:Reverse transcriptase domain-containing protein n=1 Tax=Psilocybe cf. subviscida TaxID=2480587 RepID=A0A8H5BMY9_9AGAR|nr:hypothetical protein D9619_009632 [Psilocybe cf. subviscida]
MAEWTSAWNQIKRATRFLFKHRADELRTYGDWMQEEFAAKVPSSHIRIIRYDAALRREVGGGTHHLLTDEQHFSRLYKAIVVPDGQEYASGSTTTKKSSSAQICNKYNSDEGCSVREGESEGGLRGESPKFLRYNIYETAEEAMDLKTTAEWSETAAPIPRIPDKELNNPVVQATLREHPELFKVDTPVNVDNFEALLRGHPNRPLVDSVVDGLRNGFWPWADTKAGVYPDTYEEKRGPPRDEMRASFIRKKRDEEVEKGHYSQAFEKLLPGMYCMPIHAVPKSDVPGDFRLVSDQSAGEFSINSMVDDKKIHGFPLDNMTHVAEMLLHARSKEPDEELVMFKCDIADAYRLLPMHPCWQIKQIVPVGDVYHADRRNMFGGKASGSLFIAFNSLIAWIIKFVLLLAIIRAYVDDSFGMEKKGRIAWYQPYKKFMPTAQVRVLQLWDYLGVPHKEKKQVSGAPLTIIGIEVDPNAMTFTLPEESKTKLVEELRYWGKKPEKKTHGAFRLRQWQVLTGWMNWLFNVYPQLRPSLNNVYDKMRGEHCLSKTVWVNNDIRDDLNWAARALERAAGVQLIHSTRWDLSTADVTIYADACLEGMGFWVPEKSLGFYSPVPFTAKKEIIFFWEATCVLAALNYAHNIAKDHDRIVIFTDNTNTVDIFSSLHCLPAYNQILVQAMSLVLLGRYDLRVIYVPGILEVAGSWLGLRRCDDEVVATTRNGLQHFLSFSSVFIASHPQQTPAHPPPSLHLSLPPPSPHISTQPHGSQPPSTSTVYNYPPIHRLSVPTH